MAEAVFRRPWDDRQARPRRFTPPQPARRAWPSARIAGRVSALQNFSPTANPALSRKRQNGAFLRATGFYPDPGALILTGYAPVGLGDTILAQDPAALLLSGLTPSVLSSVAFAPDAGSLLLAGQAPGLLNGVVSSPAQGVLTLAAAPPSLLSGSVFSLASAGVVLTGFVVGFHNLQLLTPSAGALTLTGHPVVGLVRWTGSAAGGPLTFTGASAGQTAGFIGKTAATTGL